MRSFIRYFSALRVVAGDACAPQTYQRVFRDGEVLPTILITDPPYLIFHSKREEKGIKRKRKLQDHPCVPRFESKNEYYKFTDAWFQLSHKYIAPNSPVIIFTNPLGKGVITEVLHTYGYNLYGEYIWGKKVDNKKNNVNEYWLRVNETALVFTNPRTKLSEERLSRFTWSCVTNGEDSIHHEHPCYKPNSCLQPLLSQFLSPHDIVFDPFVGSGSILKAAQQLCNNRIYGIEILEEWVDKANGHLLAIK